MDSLDLKYARSVLQRLLEKEVFMKSDLFDIVTSNQVLDKLLDSLKEDGYIIKELSPYGRRTYSISLTPRGRIIAEQYKKADDAAKGATIYEDEGRIEVRAPEEWREKWKNLKALFHVNVYEDHVTIIEASDHGKVKERAFNIYTRENGRDHLRLWCEEDESFDCYHVGYAFTLAPVQDMFAKIRGGK